jgi:spermidine synthase
MKKETLLDQTLSPDGKKVGLFERDGTYSIRIDGTVLMSTRQHASEEKLASLACAHLESRANCRILIGGLGFGFTLRAALASLPRRATVVVAEIMEAVIAWNRNPAYPFAAVALSDKRVSVEHRDVAAILEKSRGRFDAILLDVDNDPSALTTKRNRRLYEKAGLSLAKAALASGGCLAVWSAIENPAFARLMQSSGLRTEVHRSRAHTSSGAMHSLFLGWKD